MGEAPVTLSSCNYNFLGAVLKGDEIAGHPRLLVDEVRTLAPLFSDQIQPVGILAPTVVRPA